MLIKVGCYKTLRLHFTSLHFTSSLLFTAKKMSTIQKVNARRAACAALRISRPGLILGNFNISYYDLAEPVPLAVIDCNIAWGTDEFNAHLAAGRQDDAKRHLLFYVQELDTAFEKAFVPRDAFALIRGEEANLPSLFGFGCRCSFNS